LEDALRDTFKKDGNAEGDRALSLEALAKLAEDRLNLVEVERALGPRWLEGLLVRCWHLSWSGGPKVLQRRPQINTALQRLAETFTGVSGESDELPEEPADLLVRSWDSVIRQSICGTYVIKGTHHGRPLYGRTAPSTDELVVLYYWDGRHGAEEEGWWFGPKVGDDLAFAHRGRTTEQDYPPVHGWKWMPQRTWQMLPANAAEEAARPEDTNGAFRVYCVKRPQQMPPPGCRPEAKLPRPSAAAVTAAAAAAPAVAAAPAAAAPSVVAHKQFPATSAGSAPEPCISTSSPPREPRPSSLPPPPPQEPDEEPIMSESSQRQGVRPVATPQRHEWAGGQASQPVNNESLQKFKRKRQESQMEREQQLKNWLLGLDDGAGVLMQYFDVLRDEFDADLMQIAGVKGDDSNSTTGLLGAVDPIFWETVKAPKLGHRILLARGILAL